MLNLKVYECNSHNLSPQFKQSSLKYNGIDLSLSRVEKIRYTVVCLQFPNDKEPNILPRIFIFFGLGKKRRAVLQFGLKFFNYEKFSSNFPLFNSFRQHEDYLVTYQQLTKFIFLHNKGGLGVASLEWFSLEKQLHKPFSVLQIIKCAIFTYLSI